MKTPATVLKPHEVERIHEASLEILANVGLMVNNTKARERFARHGCRVNDETMHVTFPRKVIEQFCTDLPTQFTFYARDPQYDRTIPDNSPIFLTSSSAPNIIDPVTGEERSARSDDIARIAHLINQLEGIDVFSVSTLASDGPEEHLMGVSRFYPAMKNCVKPIRGSSPPKEAEQILQLCYLIAGSEEAYREHPFFMHHYCPVISPLKMDDDSVEVLMMYTERGLPSYATMVPNAGLTAPITLAGTLVQANVEFLATAALTQMTRVGTPLIYSSLPTVGDMRSGAYAPGGIECAILNMGSAQLARFYDLPYSFYTGTNSKVCDAQAGYERGISLMAGLLGGADVIQFAGLLDALMAFDYATAVVDNEMALMLKRMKRGIEFAEEDFALEVIKEVGPGGTFDVTQHTMDRRDRTAIAPNIADRNTRKAWVDNGARNASQRALRRAREILSQENDVVFSPEVDARIRAEFEGIVAGDAVLPPKWL